MITTVSFYTTSPYHTSGNEQYHDQTPIAFFNDYRQATYPQYGSNVLSDTTGGFQTNQQSHHQVNYDTRHQVYQAPNILYPTQHNAYQNASEYQTATYMGFNSDALAEPETSSNDSLLGNPMCIPVGSPTSTPIGTSSTTIGSLVPSNKPYVCVYNCGKAFDRKGDMKRHAQSHEPPKFWCLQEGCKHSLKGFYRKDKLTAHLRTHGIYL